MAGLLDFAQAASNSAAGNVAGPIDMLAWGLRKMGLPIPNDPVLGTEWMKQKGLIKEVPQSPASLAGETFGLLSPIVAAAKAPQIAGGLLQMGDNLSTAKTLGSGPGGGQKGAIVYHGSPHKFDKFDSSKIGTGEGAQAYGHGLYLAESPDVAKSYQRALSDSEFVLKSSGKSLRDAKSSGGFAPMMNEMMRNGKTTDDVISTLDGIGRRYKDKYGRDAAKLAEKLRSGAIDYKTGSLYKVDLPDDQIARMLDWDKPLSQQAPEVLDVLRSNAPSGSLTADVLAGRASKPDYQGVDALLDIKDGIGLRGKGPGVPELSQWLRQRGIPGIRYLDGGSRGAGQGTSNFVVFPGNEGLLTILERNGVPLR